MFYRILLIFLKKKWQEALVKFVSLREKKFFLQKFASQASEIKKIVTQPVDRKQRYFSRRPRILNCVMATLCRLPTTLTYLKIYIFIFIWTRCHLVFRLLVLFEIEETFALQIWFTHTWVPIVINVPLINLFKLFSLYKCIIDIFVILIILV